MSIGIILALIKPILNYFKNHKSELVMLIIVIICGVIIIAMFAKLKHKDNLISKNKAKIEGLEITNDIYATQIVDYEKQLYELSKLTNMIEKIKYIPVYQLPEENKVIYEEISNSFLEMQAGDYGEIGNYTNYNP